MPYGGGHPAHLPILAFNHFEPDPAIRNIFPKSDRWMRITLFQNAPLPEEVGRSDPDDWALPASS